MRNFYLYYRLLFVLHGNEASAVRLRMQDVLIDLRDKASAELRWSCQQTQDFAESLCVTGSPHRDPDEIQLLVERERRRMALYPEVQR